MQLKKHQSKIITVTHGKILSNSIILKKKSKTLAKYVSIVISDIMIFHFL